MAEIVIMGAGIGGVPMAFDMKLEKRGDDNITVISDKSYFQFTPSNPWAAVGWRKKEDITIELAPVMKKQGIGFIHDAVAKVDPTSNKVVLASGKEVAYDYLVIASDPNWRLTRSRGLAQKVTRNLFARLSTRLMRMVVGKSSAKTPVRLWLGRFRVLRVTGLRMNSP